MVGGARSTSWKANDCRGLELPIFCDVVFVLIKAYNVQPQVLAKSNMINQKMMEQEHHCQYFRINFTRYALTNGQVIEKLRYMTVAQWLRVRHLVPGPWV